MKWLFLCLALLPAAFGAANQYHDILGSGKREWRLVFRGTAGVGKSMFHAYWHRVAGHVPAGCKTVNWKAPCNNHYRNDAALAKWSGVDKVLVGVIQGGVMVKTIVYNAAKSSFRNWMHKARFEYSCWEDLSSTNTNFNSIVGHGQIHRRFFINQRYGGCPNDFGWLTVVDTPRPPCPWERRVPNGGAFRFPRIMYAPGAKRINWNTNDVMDANALAIFIKYKPVGGSPSEYHDVQGTGKKEWRLAFRGTANIRKSVYAAYATSSSVPTHVDYGCKTTNWKLPCRQHYRNDDALDSWKNVKQVMFGVVHNGALVKTATFNGVGSDNLNWMSQPRLIHSCWEDLKVKRTNFFRVAGHAHLSRRFFISHRYGGCPQDWFWFVAVDKANPPCAWEKSPSWPTFRYAAGTRVANGNDKMTMRYANSIVIFLKY